jgi:hypothetical protein
MMIVLDCFFGTLFYAVTPPIAACKNLFQGKLWNALVCTGVACLFLLLATLVNLMFTIGEKKIEHPITGVIVSFVSWRVLNLGEFYGSYLH